MCIKSEGLGDHVFGTLEHFSQTMEYNEIGWLLLTVLVELGKQSDELRASSL